MFVLKVEKREGRDAGKPCMLSNVTRYVLRERLESNILCHILQDLWWEFPCFTYCPVFYCLLCFGKVWRGFLYKYCSFTYGDFETWVRLGRGHPSIFSKFTISVTRADKVDSFCTIYTVRVEKVDSQVLCQLWWDLRWGWGSWNAKYCVQFLKLCGESRDSGVPSTATNCRYMYLMRVKMQESKAWQPYFTISAVKSWDCVRELHVGKSRRLT